MPELKVVSGPGAPRTIQLPLAEQEWVVGTGPSCQVVLEDALVRDRHVRIRRRGLGYTIEPLGEGSSFEVNEQETDSAIPLHEGDEIQLGQTSLAWTAGDAIEAVAMGITLEDSLSSSGVHVAPAGLVSPRPYVGTEITAGAGASFMKGSADVVTGDHLIDAVTQTIQALRDGSTVPETSLASLSMAFGADRALLYLPFGGERPRLMASFLGPAELDAEEGITAELLAEVKGGGAPALVNLTTAAVVPPDQAPAADAASLRSLMATPVPFAGGEGTLAMDAPVGKKRFSPQDQAVLGSFSAALSFLLNATSRIARMEELIENWSSAQTRALRHVPDGPPELEEVLHEVAASSKPVLLVGEPGAGKRTAALRLHRSSRRGAEPVLVLDCATEEDLSTALFGRVDEQDGEAATGALEDAERGTLVLANVTALTMKLQSRLQTYLETGCFECEGDASRRSSEARLVLTADRDPAEEGGAGWFHAALLKRFGARRRVCVPPLRETPEFLVATATRQVRAAALRFKKAVEGLDEEARQLVLEYPWPGNHDELWMVMQRAVRAETRARLSRPVLARALGRRLEG